jgi:hypothetical protein
LPIESTPTCPELSGKGFNASIETGQFYIDYVSSIKPRQERIGGAVNDLIDTFESSEQLNDEVNELLKDGETLTEVLSDNNCSKLKLSSEEPSSGIVYQRYDKVKTPAAFGTTRHADHNLGCPFKLKLKYSLVKDTEVESRYCIILSLKVL